MHLHGSLRHLVVGVYVLLLSPVAALAQPKNIADELINRFTEAWGRDDSAAVFEMLADDVVFVDADTLIDGREAFMGYLRQVMGETGRLTKTPIQSGTHGDVAYQVGRWALGTSRGVHTFVFRRGSDGVWRITSAHVEDSDAVATE